MYNSTTQQTIDLPNRSRPAFIAWQAGGRQEFPNDRVADAARERNLRSQGLIKMRRIPRSQTN